MKMKQFALVWALALVMTLAGCVEKDNPVSPEKPTEKKPTYTILVYGNAGGAMDGVIETGVWEKLKPLLTEDSNVRVQFCYKYGMDTVDEEGNHTFNGKYGEPGDVFLFELRDTTNLEQLRSSDAALQSPDFPLYEPSLLSLLLSACNDLMPADNYILIIWGHGSGFVPYTDLPHSQESLSTRGVLADEWLSDEEVSMYDIEQAISTSSQGKLKAVFFHDCLMGNIESLSQVQPCADYLIASEHLLWSGGEPIVEFVKSLQSHSTFEGAMDYMFSHMPKEWYEAYATGASEPANGDLKLLRTAYLDEVTACARQLANRLVEIYPTQKEALDRAADKCYQVDPEAYAMLSDIGLYSFFDLADYARQCALATGDVVLQKISDSLEQAFDDAIAYGVNYSYADRHLNRYTLSVILTSNKIYNNPNALSPDKPTYRESYESTRFHQTSGWGKWLGTNEHLPQIINKGQ